MVVVVAIVIVILLLVVPAASSLWAERKLADTVNMVQGMLMTARASSLQPDGAEHGFLAYVDDEGVQHLVKIRTHDRALGKASCEPPMTLADCQIAWADVFQFTDERDQIVPPPVRVLPRYAVCADDPSRGPDCGSDHDEPYELFDDVGDELDNENFEAPSAPIYDQAQRHRNFFTMIFSTGGTLRINRDVLIQDPDEEDESNGRGDRTGQRVGPGLPDMLTTTQFHVRAAPPATEPIDGDMGATPFAWLIVDADNTAINFPSVDGLLVYDDSLFKAVLPRDQKRFWLCDNAQPLYLARMTGAMVKGPLGESCRPTTP